MQLCLHLNTKINTKALKFAKDSLYVVSVVLDLVVMYSHVHENDTPHVPSSTNYRKETNNLLGEGVFFKIIQKRKHKRPSSL